MRIGFAEQYSTAVVILEEGDNDPEKIIEMCEMNEATYEADDHYLVVRFPGRPDEVYTEDAVRRSFKTPSASSS